MLLRVIGNIPVTILPAVLQLLFAAREVDPLLELVHGRLSLRKGRILMSGQLRPDVAAVLDAFNSDPVVLKHMLLLDFIFALA